MAEDFERSEPMRFVYLTDAELLHLDGRVNAKAQAEVDAARGRLAMQALRPDLPSRLAGFIADVVTEARTNGLVVLRQKSLSRCHLCGESKGYANYKSGPRRGTPNYDRPIRLTGFDLADRFVTMEGHAQLGGCKTCIEALLPDLREALADVHAEVVPALATEGRPHWVRYRNRRCTQCDWTGHEGEMGRRSTLLGDGTYPASCPSCGAENQPFGRSPVELHDGWTVVDEAAVCGSQGAQS